MKRPNIWEYTSLIQLTTSGLLQGQQGQQQSRGSSRDDHDSGYEHNCQEESAQDDEMGQQDNGAHHKIHDGSNYHPFKQPHKVKSNDDEIAGDDDDGDVDNADVDHAEDRFFLSDNRGNKNRTHFSHANSHHASNKTTTTTQTCFNLDAIISKKARNQTLMTITRAGTKSSRSGLYIRPSWKHVIYQHFQRKYRMYIAMVILLFGVRHFLVQKRHHGDENDLSDSLNSSGQPNDDGLLIDLGNGGYQKFPHGKSTNDDDNGTLCGMVESSVSSATAVPSHDSDARFKCMCTNPMQAKMGTFPGWKKAHEANKMMVDDYYRYSHDASSNQKMLDVVFLGDSITEEWNGRWMGVEQDRWKDIHTEWKRLFDPKVTKGALNGLALGIAGDSISNLLWRIQNGELDRVQSKVFWLLIGTNDLSLGCSDKTVLLGILHVAEEIRKQRPDAIIVLNGILPRTSDSDGRLDGGGIQSLRNAENGTWNDESVSSASTSMAPSSERLALPSPSSQSQPKTQSQPQPQSQSHIQPQSQPQPQPQPQTSLDSSKINTMWQSIQSINRSLAKFAEQHDRIEYFDASQVFIARMSTQFYRREDELFLLKELQNDFLHPMALGHRLWGEAIVDFMISDMDTPANLRGRQGRRMT